jgi:hypothetical protein
MPESLPTLLVRRIMDVFQILPRDPINLSLDFNAYGPCHQAPLPTLSNCLDILARPVLKNPSRILGVHDSRLLTLAAVNHKSLSLPLNATLTSKLLSR